MGDEVTKDEPITTNPNVGGFGQARWLPAPDVWVDCQNCKAKVAGRLLFLILEGPCIDMLNFRMFCVSLVYDKFMPGDDEHFGE